METDNIWTVEYSWEQDVFRISPINETIERNRKAMFAKKWHGYSQIDFCSSKEEAEEKEKMYREMVDKKVLWKDVNGNIRVKDFKK